MTKFLLPVFLLLCFQVSPVFSEAKVSGKALGKAVGSASGKAIGTASGKASDGASEKATDNPSEMAPDKVSDKPSDKSSDKAPDKAPDKPSDKAPDKASDKVSVEIGKNVKIGMSLKDAITLLGIPGFVKVNRGTEPAADSLVIEYPDHGLVIHALNKGTTVEGLEMLPGFKGEFPSGVKIGDKFPVIVDKYGVPQSMSMEIARYPELGLYFNLKEGVLLSAKMFMKGSKLLDSRLADPAAN